MIRYPLLLDIKHNSLDDGPGIRSVIFFKGCPLNCLWCHNPESKQPGPGISYDLTRCIRCDTCIVICPKQAISPENPYFLDRSRCTYCYQCTDNCPSGALLRIGLETTQEQLVQEVLKYQPFYDNSGGGVTLSGGEPTLFLEFAGTLAQQLKSNGIHVLLETCGCFNLGKASRLLLPYVDMVYYDIKLFDEAQHIKYCGVSNRIILSNLAQLIKQPHPAVLPRLPLIPGITDTTKNIREIAAYLKQINATELALLPNNPTWLSKRIKFGLEAHLYDDILKQYYSEERLQEIQEHFTEQNLTIAE